MKKLILTLVVAFAFQGLQSQVVQLEGPRFGVSFISDGSTAQMLQRKFDMDSAAFAMDPNGSSITTQYGWQWEKRFADNGGDVVGLVEWVVMVAGMEKGMFLPSLTTMVGVRGRAVSNLERVRTFRFPVLALSSQLVTTCDRVI